MTKLRGPERGVYYDLYVILDIYSRYVVGWTVAAREDAGIAKDLIETAAQIHGAPGSLHADRGTSMTSKPVAQLLVDLGVAHSHSRPHVSNDCEYERVATGRAWPM
ncbi:MAG: DDE-type integrase/transposase/recombinase [Actinobacteria bacterium]|nr:DDE-type integrase/transposase/recombinase [Actinomycetota bacterium]